MWRAVVLTILCLDLAGYAGGKKYCEGGSSPSPQCKSCRYCRYCGGKDNSGTCVVCEERKTAESDARRKAAAAKRD